MIRDRWIRLGMMTEHVEIAKKAVRLAGDARVVPLEEGRTGAVGETEAAIGRRAALRMPALQSRRVLHLDAEEPGRPRLAQFQVPGVPATGDDAAFRTHGFGDHDFAEMAPQGVFDDPGREEVVAQTVEAAGFAKAPGMRPELNRRR